MSKHTRSHGSHVNRWVRWVLGAPNQKWSRGAATIIRFESRFWKNKLRHLGRRVILKSVRPTPRQVIMNWSSAFSLSMIRHALLRIKLIVSIGLLSGLLSNFVLMYNNIYITADNWQFHHLPQEKKIDQCIASFKTNQSWYRVKSTRFG